MTAGTIFHRTRTPLTTWFAAAWYMTNQKLGASALGLQRALGLGSYQTTWTMLHKYRTAMVRPSRDRLSGEGEVDETYVGGEEPGVRGRQTRKKAIVVIGVEVVRPKGFGWVRMRRVPDASGNSLIPFVCEAVRPGSVILTDSWGGNTELPAHGYTRFNRRTSRRRGLLFYRLLEQAVVTDPTPYRAIVGGTP